MRSSRSTASRTRAARFPALLLTFGILSGCGGDDTGEGRVEDVDQSSPAGVTERELAAFREPSDSVLTPQQVEAYLRTTLLQFDLIRKEARGLHERAATMEKREKKGGTLAGLRNLADAGRLVMGYADLVGGSYVRSARSLGYNPAEMEWVRDRMVEVSGHLMMRPMYEEMLKQAQNLRVQAEEYRQQSASGELQGFGDELVNQLTSSADEAERNAREEMRVSRALERNLEVLHRARSNVTDPMWATIAFVGGTGGLFGLSGLMDPDDPEARRQLDEWRRIYTDALNNQVTEGMEAGTLFGEARPLRDP
jgi:hypothetical protein